MKLMLAIMTVIGIICMMVSKYLHGGNDILYYGLVTIMVLLNAIAQKVL